MASQQWVAIATEARRLGFAAVGCAAVPDDGGAMAARLTAWLAAGYHGDMAWMARNADRRRDPCAILATARTVISCTMNYFTPPPHGTDSRRGRISRYAWGDDYHDVLLSRLEALLQFLRTIDPTAEGLAYVDTGPVLEKPWAARAGLGWQGKHTNLIDPKRGSWCFVGEIITTMTMDTVGVGDSDTWGTRGADSGPWTRDQGISAFSPESRVPGLGSPPSLCGTCTRCIDVCPTRAIVAPYQLDARKCISYLTIEHPGSIPIALRPLLGNHIYGCDLCQEVCPWNRFATPTPEPAFQPRAENLNPVLIELMAMTEDEFHRRFAGSPIRRIKRRRFLRNVAVALGNSKDPRAIPVLRRACNDAEPLIREHAAWALAGLQQR
ncbi:MAG: tRNA epoxyqueuosine(34) reductase QueG [Deltaproteobacteria bacterium]|nr:tRNA epoxyqueuosine(34) reductase QueG [Deltaproteobacteria bacterium]